MSEKTNNKIGKKQVIQYMVDKCQESSGTFNFSARVRSLRDFICLEMPELRSAIIKKERQLKVKAGVKASELLKDDLNEYFHPGKRMIHNIDINEELYEDFDTFLNNIVNKHN